VSRPWDADEIAWARECFRAGDSFEDIAEGAGRSVADVRAVLGSGQSIAPRQREVLSLYVAGCTFSEIAAELGYTSPNARKIPATVITSLRRRGFDIPLRTSAHPLARSGS
jgi:FixJ family two-component response regulator